MRKLIAKYPILYLSKQYDIGEELVANNPEMVKAWLDAGTAEWKEDETMEEGLEEGDEEAAPMATPDKGGETPPAFATPVSHEAGLEGEAVNAEILENLVGKVPKTPARSRK
nr:MAG TPA: hypothetical protein [Caudoviricetes sp.]